MKIAALAFTDTGFATAQKLSALSDDYALDRCAPGKLGEWTADAFSRCDALIYVGACGIAVRAIAPFVRVKTEDPCVLVVDEQGRYVIPVLSGHIGGGNELALAAAKLLGALPVITTATDLNGLFAVTSGPGSSLSAFQIHPASRPFRESFSGGNPSACPPNTRSAAPRRTASSCRRRIPMSSWASMSAQAGPSA